MQENKSINDIIQNVNANYHICCTEQQKIRKKEELVTAHILRDTSSSCPVSKVK